jgi:YidC/Oxa1 family membrane protein insertase
LDSKRLALAFALAAVILIGWQVLVAKLFPDLAPKPPAASPTPSAAPAEVSTPGTASPPPAPAPPTVAAAKPVSPVSATAERHLVVTTGGFSARLTNRGGDILSFTLAHHRDAEGKPLDLVPRAGVFPGRNLRLAPQDELLARAANALHEVETKTEGLETTIRFHYRESSGEGVVRTYVFGPRHEFDLDVLREGSGGPVGVVLGPGIGNHSDTEIASSQYSKPGSSVVIWASGSADRKGKEGPKEPESLGLGLAAAGIEDRYFVTAFLPGKGASAVRRGVEVGTGTKSAERYTEVEASATGRLVTRVLFAPKDVEALTAVDTRLRKLVDYGMFELIVRPLLWSLRELHAFSRNWGVAIVLLTLFIKNLLYPQTHKQLVSMKRMSAVQPKLQAIQAKWAPRIKQDPQNRLKLNEEVMAVYKSEGINPASGCLPLLLQMPILFALYSLLANAIELRQAPFVLWIHDLSVKDPYYVWPILMTITMWLQQQLSPPMGDPAMRKVMAIMPFVFGFLFKDVPAGLVVYWTVQNVLTIVQQEILNKFTDLGPRSAQRKA